MTTRLRIGLCILLACLPRLALALDEYRLDDGVKESGIGIQSAGSNSIAWLNHFTIQPGFETISAIRVAFGGGSFSINIPNNSPITLYLWGEINQDGDPSDAFVVATVPGIISGSGMNSLNTFPLPSTVTFIAGESIFAGVIANYTGQVQVASIDNDGTDSIPFYPPAMQSWIAGSANGTSVNPNAMGLAQIPLARVSNVLAGDGTWMIRLNALVATPSAISITPNPLSFGAVAVGDITGPSLVTISSTGIGTLNVTSISPALAPFTQEPGGSCLPLPFVLAPGTSCTMAFSFGPNALGPVAQNLSVQSNAPTSPDAMSLDGAGIASDPVLSPAVLTFAEVDIKSTASIDMSVFNPGVAILDVGGWSVSGPQPSAFTHAGGNCGPLPFSLPPGAACTMSFQFLPLHHGAHTEQAYLISNARPGSGVFMFDGTAVIFDDGFEP